MMAAVKLRKTNVNDIGYSKSSVSFGDLKFSHEETLQDKCKKYYRSSKKKYNDFFMNCVEEIESLQPSAFACVQAMRYFVVGILPQYCVIPDPLTKKQRERVERILATK